MTMKPMIVWIVALPVALFSAILNPDLATAQQANSTPATNIIGEFARCREMMDDRERLACFDGAAGALAAVGEVALVSRADVARSQRQLFGFNASLLNPFSGRGDSDELASITSAMASARQTPSGWLVTLEDGSVWRQIDTTRAVFSSRQRHEVTVRRAALGSYMMKVGNAPAFRVKRD